MDYIDLDLSSDSAELYAGGVDRIQAELGDAWQPSPAERALLLAVAWMASQILLLAGRVPLEAFTYFGQSVLRIAAIEASAATGEITVTAIDTVGHTLDAGAQFDIDGVGFVLVADLVIPAASSSGTGAVIAAAAGETANSVTGGTITLISPAPPVWVDTISLTAPTMGGSNGETGREYVDRLADEIPLLSPKAIYWPEYAIVARRDPAVMRALAINRYVPAGPGGTPAAQTDVEGAITVAVHDQAGNDPGATVRQRITDALTGTRVRGVDVAVIAPTYTLIDVTFTAHAHDGWDPAAVEVAAEAAIADFLSPINWGRPTLGDPDDWVDEPTVRRLDLIGALYRVEGIRHVDSLTLARDGNALATSDVTLDGPAALPRPDTINGTVTL